MRNRMTNRVRSRARMILTFACFVGTSWSQQDSLLGLQTETFLHPGDGFTAYTLKKNEFIYNQSPRTFPLPSWAWWGITDKITAEIDLLPLIGGLFVEPHIPVPSINFRFKLREQRGWIPAMAYETMYQHLWRTQNQMDTIVIIEREPGNSWFNRVNVSWYNNRRLRLHCSAGFTYSENLRIRSQDTVNINNVFFRRTINPDVSISLDYRPLPWLSLHLTTSYGTTFVYLDNIPRKFQICDAWRIQPFYKSRYGFLRTLHAEFAGFYMYFPDAKAGLIEAIVPYFPYFYWQWQLSKNNKQRR